VSFPKSIYMTGVNWLQNLSIPPFARRDESAAYFNAVPSRYSQLSKVSYATVLLNSITTGHFSPTNPGNARRLVLATGMEFVGLRLARSEGWHELWWVPQTLAIGINLGSFGSNLAAAEAAGADRMRIPLLRVGSRRD
jgi:hypothetical protein